MEQNNPAISVIVAAYNAEKDIRRCLDSICSQTFENLEIIVVNDGSTDQTLDILGEYENVDSRIKIIDQENQGAGKAKNAGLKAATGDYIAFVDSDDWIEKETFMESYGCTENGKIDMVVYNHNKIFPNRELRNVRKMKEELIRMDDIGIEKYVMKYMISFNHEFGAWNKLVRREIIDKYGIEFSDNKKTIYDDNLYCLKLICHVETIRTLNRAFYNYNIRSGSVSDMSNTYEKLALGYTYMLQEFRNYVCEQGMLDQWKSVFPLLYYSMVFFGLTRLKRFGGMDIRGVAKKLSETEYYSEYMSQINKLSVRVKYITKTVLGIGTLKNDNWQLMGLIFLTLVQGKLIASNAIKNKYDRVDFWI